MKSIVNNTKLIGNLGKDVILTSFENGGKKASCTIATTEYHKNEKGERTQKTTWHNLVAWGRNAELMARILHKGAQVIVEGSMSYREYTNKNDEKKSIAELIVHEFRMVNASASKNQEAVVTAPF
jgi:single-strand DNA-binding protein